jgi:hypothetical protein
MPDETGGREDGKTGGREDGKTGGREDGKTGGREEDYWNVSITDQDIDKIRHIYRPGNKKPGSFI